MNITQPVLAICDRGYPSIEFIDFLETKKINYLFRLSSNESLISGRLTVLCT
ncbi:MAG TPA: transposase [Candidatus Mediterraneibacter ornithocaccae]|nr:transposase [Candidatus Mediterraneibacter ornithocaccae]